MTCKCGNKMARASNQCSSCYKKNSDSSWVRKLLDSNRAYSAHRRMVKLAARTDPGHYLPNF